MAQPEAKRQKTKVGRVDGVDGFYARRKNRKYFRFFQKAENFMIKLTKLGVSTFFMGFMIYD